MNLLREIGKQLGAEAGVGVEYTVVDGRGGYFRNVKRIEEFSEQVVVLRSRKGAVRVEGRGLSLGRYGSGDAVVLGEIARVEKI